MRLPGTPGRSAVTVPAVALLAGAVVVVLSVLPQGQHRAGARPALETSPGATVAEAESFRSFGVTLAPVGASTVPGISSAAAVAAARANGVRPDVQASIEPGLRLASLTNTILGQTGAPPFGAPKLVDVLVWDVRYPDAPTEVHGPVTGTAGEAPHCDLHVIVDATTAKVIEGFQSCDAASSTAG